MKDKNIKQKIVKNSFWSFVANTTNRLGALVFTILLARFLMPANYGLYVIILSTSMIFYTLADLGINAALTRYLSSALARNRKKIPSYHSYLLKIKIVLSLSFSGILFLLAYPLSIYVFRNSALIIPFFVAAFYVLVLSFEGFYTQVFYAIEKVKYVGLKESITQILRITLAVAVFYFISSSYQVVGIFLSLIVVHLFVLLLVLYYLRKLIPELYQKPKHKIDKKRVRRFVSFLTIAGISGVFFSYIDSIMLGLFLPSEYIGYYGAAFSLILGATGLLYFPNLILLPLFTKINKSKIKNVFNQAFRYTAILSIPSILGLLVLRRYVIKLFYGHAYMPSALPLYFLSFLIFPIVSAGLFLSLFSAEEKPEIFAKFMAISCVLNIVLNFILIKAFLLISQQWAIAGAAIATLTSWTFYLISLNYVAKKQQGFAMAPRFIIRPLISSLIMAGALFYIIRTIQDITPVSGALLIPAGILIYFTIMVLIGGVKKQDLELIYLLLKKQK